MYAVTENSFTRRWKHLGQILPRPKAILVISAHWETFETFVTSMPKPRIIYDFYGFPAQLFEAKYEAVGEPKLARQMAETLSLRLDENWGLDHGSWAILRHFYPKADIPVLQLSLDRLKTAAEHYEFAKGLLFLRQKGVLIIGSGNLVHNLRLANFRNQSGDEWAISANEILKQLILSDDHESLINYQNLGKEVALAVPTPEHYLPLLYVLALKISGEKIEIFNDVVELSSLSMTSLTIS